MIADMLSNKNLYPIFTESFIRGRMLSIYFILLQNLIAVSKNSRLNSRHFIMKTPKKSKKKLKKILFNHS